MKLSHFSIGTAALCLASFALAPRAQSAELTLSQEGWSSWQIGAVDQAPDWCCWSDGINFRDAARMSCRLDASSQSFGEALHQLSLSTWILFPRRPGRACSTNFW